jgi:hypothetical protein
MALTRYSSGSPYAATQQTTWYLDTLVLREVNPDHTDTIMVVPTQYNLQPYNLSYDLYGTKDYWWAFMVLNPDVIRDPIYDFVAGITIRVPTKERLIGNIQAVK